MFYCFCWTHDRSRDRCDCCTLDCVVNPSVSAWYFKQRPAFHLSMDSGPDPGPAIMASFMFLLLSCSTKRGYDFLRTSEACKIVFAREFLRFVAIKKRCSGSKSIQRMSLNSASKNTLHKHMAKGRSSIWCILGGF